MCSPDPQSISDTVLKNAPFLQAGLNPKAPRTFWRFRGVPLRHRSLRFDPQLFLDNALLQHVVRRASKNPASHKSCRYLCSCCRGCPNGFAYMYMLLAMVFDKL